MEYTKADSSSEAIASDGTAAAVTRKSHTTLEMEIGSLLSLGNAAAATAAKSSPLREHTQAFEAQELSTEASCSKDVSQQVNNKLTSYSMRQSLDKADAILSAATSSVAAEALRLSKQVDGATQCHNCEFRSPASTESIPSIGSLVCRICHNADNPEQLVSPCLCKGSLSYVHIHCLERWISTSRCTTCELCQFKYNTEQTLRYSCIESLRIWYSRAMSRRTLQEDCQMFSLLTLVAFGIIGTLLVGIQYYGVHSQSWQLSKLWTRSWMFFFLFMTISVYFANIYLLIKSQLSPWYRWWQSAQDIRLILENRRPFPNPNRGIELSTVQTSEGSMFPQMDPLKKQLQKVGFSLTPSISYQKSMPDLPITQQSANTEPVIHSLCMPGSADAASLDDGEAVRTASTQDSSYADTVEKCTNNELNSDPNKDANSMSRIKAITTTITALTTGMPTNANHFQISDSQKSES